MSALRPPSCLANVGVQCTYMAKRVTTRRVKGQRTSIGSSRRTRRLNIRASVEQENLIREAAQRRGENLTDFVLRSACVEAELTLSDKRSFALPPEKWKAFLTALDKPPVIKPQLKKLFTEASILEAQR
jgi:uncharacterized protein (DUF1778 family)